VQLLWFLPSLAYGAMLAATSHNYFLLGSSAFTLVIAALLKFRQSRIPKLSAQTEVKIVGSRVWLDDYRMPRAEILWSREQADLIFERLADSGEPSEPQRQFLTENFELPNAPLSFALGFNSQRIVCKSLVQDGPHAILIGSTGSGKTEMLRSAIRQLIRDNSTLQLVCIDFKGGAGLGEFADKSLGFASDHDMRAAEVAIDKLERELRERELGQKPQSSMVIAIDELGHLLATVKSAAAALAAIAARGRSANMHLVMTNQNLVGISRALLSNVSLRILIGTPDPVDATMLGQVAKISGANSATAANGLAKAQVLGHGQTPEVFSFALPNLPREPRPALEPIGREPLRRQRSTRRHRVSSGRERARHRLSRPLAIRDLLSRAHMAASR
jgi:S-DNA-T family DNA segregation ATPase FtsK/SpoIIIE